MNQMDLFDAETPATDATKAETFPIRSGHVGPIRFGSTEASHGLTRDVLAELAMRSDDTEKGSS